MNETPVENRTPISELARIVTYLAGFAVGLLALVLGIIQSDYELVGLGLLITGIGATATAYVPSIHDSWKKREGKHAE